MVSVLLYVAACSPGFVEVDGIGPFGDLKSARWYEGGLTDTFVLWSDVGTLEESGVGLDPLSLRSERPDSCAATQRWWHDLEEVSADFLAATDRGADQEAVCREVPGFLDAVEALDPVTARDTRPVNSFSLSVECDDAPCGPELGTWRPEDEERHLSGWLAYSGDTGSCPTGSDRWDAEACIGKVSDCAEDSQFWSMASGSLEILSVTANRVEADVEGTLEPVGDGETATVTASFTAERCEIDADGVVIVF